LRSRRDADGGESEKGAQRWVAAFIDAVGGKGRKGGLGQHSRGRERQEGRGEGPSAAVGDRHRPVADGRGRRACTWHGAEQGRPVADERALDTVSRGLNLV
jgi:hypothetical protein